MPRIYVPFVLSLVVLVGGCGAADSTASTRPAVVGSVATPPVTVVPESNLRMTNDVKVYQTVKDAVVNITASKVMAARVSSGNDLFDRMMPDALPTRQIQGQSLGSGFVIHPAGYIITNEHVIEDGTEVICVFSNGDKLAAQVIATDNEHDIAVLKVTPTAGKPLTAIALGSSEDLMIGEPVYAIGNPFGYAGTMTRGIISALDRTLEASPTKSYKGIIQTDTSINPGNSGGPLLNAYGQVIGINSAIRANAQGIGFAIGVSTMRDLLPAFLNPEALNHAQVGFTVEEKRTTRPPSEVTASVLVKQVQAGSDAEKVGLKAGDEILTLGGARAQTVVDALVALSGAKPEDKLALQVLRGKGSDAKKIDLSVPVTKAAPPAVEVLLMEKMGIKAETVTPAAVSKNHLAVAQGVLVTAVAAGSPAGSAGIQPGDVLVQLGVYYLTSVDDVTILLKTVKDPVQAQIGVVRGNVRGRGTISLK